MTIVDHRFPLKPRPLANWTKNKPFNQTDLIAKPLARRLKYGALINSSPMGIVRLIHEGLAVDGSGSIMPGMPPHGLNQGTQSKVRE